MNKSKRVAIYSNAWDTSAGGGIVYSIAIGKILFKNGFDVTLFFYDTILTSELQSRYNTLGLNIQILKRTGMPLCAQVRFALKEWCKFDIVIQQSLIAPRLTFVKKSFVLCDFPMGKIDTLSEKMRLKSWKNIIVNSEYTKTWVKKYWNRNAIVFYPPIEIAALRNTNKNLDLVCIGRFNEGKRSKRQDVVIEVFRDLVNKGFTNSNLHLIGYNQDNDYVDRLKKEAAGFPVFFHENCSNQKRMAILNQSALLISACGYENDENKYPMHVEHYGISVVEAMAYGCVPVVIGKGGHLETVDHNSNGYCWTKKEELKEDLINLLENSQLRERFSKAAFLKAEKYSYKVLEEKLLQVFNQG